MKRRAFLRAGLATPLVLSNLPAPEKIITVLGPIAPSELGTTLIHEHILVDFIGADQITSDRWERNKVRAAVKPFIKAAKAQGVRSFLDCTPAFLGRDVRLLKEISEENEIHILTNTGYYGAVDNKYLPTWAFTETDAQLAARWIREFEDGIEGTGIRPGFIKIGVNSGTLSDLHQKLVRAAALTHLATGLTICSHTGPALPAFEELEILKTMGVHSSAFVWVHAQAESDKSKYLTAAQRGTWVSLDGMGWGDIPKYAEWLSSLKSNGFLRKVLISHDAGWYRPGEPEPMEEFAGYTAIFEELLPLLRQKGFTRQEIALLLEANPAEAFTLRVRKT